MPHRDHAELPGWLSSASVAWIGAVLALAVLALAGAFVAHESRAIRERDLQSTEMYARVLEDQANRAFNTVDIALTTLAGTVRESTRTIDPIRLSPTLVQAQQGLPFLRSVSLLDAHGRVLASSNPDSVDIVVDPARIPMPRPGEVDRLGPLVFGRDLADAAVGTPAAPAVRHRRSFVPLVRTVPGRPDRPDDALYLAAVLNLDHFATAFQLTLDDPRRAAALFSIDGVMLAATETIRLAPGEPARQHRFFTGFLPAHESGSFVGPGIDGDTVITAFRTLRQRPISVFVEHDLAAPNAVQAATAAWTAGAAVTALAVIGAMVGMAWRSLRSHEAVRAALDLTRGRVTRSERDLRSLVESVQELIFRTDADGRIGFVNGRWESISGTARAAAHGRRLAELCEPDDWARVEALFRPEATPPALPAGADTAGEPAAVMVQIRTPSGALRTLEVSVAAVRDAQGALTGFAGFAIDVSERQLARRRLQAQLEFSARLLEVSPTPLFVKDEAGRFVTVNRAWLDLMALQPAQVIGRTSADLFGADAPRHIEQDRRLLGSEDRLSYENRLQRPGGDARDTVVTKVRFTQADGRPAGIIGSIVDVTEFREAERVIRDARDAAERASRAKSEFIADVSHELRTPLQSIIGFSEMGTALADSAPELREMFDDIHAGGRRMLRLVNGLLDVVTLESAPEALERAPCDVGELAADVVRELRAQAAARGLRLELAAPARPLVAAADAPRLRQAIRHVLDNALRHAPAGSAIGIEIAPVARDRPIDTPSPAAAGGDIEIRIRDHGPGIPDDELESIFDAFVQSSRTRDGSGGTGLGLTICRRILAAHGGSVQAGHAPGGGALLRLRLPAATDDAPSGAAAGGAPAVTAAPPAAPPAAPATETA